MATGGTFGGALRAARLVTGVSQAWLAARAGVPLVSVRAWEHGRREPLVTTAARLAWALGVSLDSLLQRGAESTVAVPTAVLPPVAVPASLPSLGLDWTTVRPLARKGAANYMKPLPGLGNYLRSLDRTAAPPDAVLAFVASLRPEWGWVDTATAARLWERFEATRQD